MELSRLRALRGPNLWSRHTAIEAIVSCAPNECDVALLANFEANLRQTLPSLGQLATEGQTLPVSLAQVLERVAFHLQATAGSPIRFSKTTQTVEIGVYQVVVQYTQEQVGRLAFEYAEQLIAAVLAQQSFDVAAAIAKLHELDEDLRLGPSTGSIVDAAQARHIPFRRLTDGSLVTLGWGKLQRRIQAAELDCTSAVAESIAQDKDLTKALLHAAGIPVPQGRSVTDAAAGWQAALDIGLPVVVKPRDGNQGKGVAVNIDNHDHFLRAYAAAEAISDEVIVERYLPGQDYRLLVVGDKLIAAARREPPLVIGDGVHTIRQLVDQVNADPRRGEGHATSLTKIRFDDIALARLQAQGFVADSIPAAGQKVVLRNNANLSTGGTATDVTDQVHPELAARAIEAAQMVGLDICGVDIVCEAIDRPLEDQGGGIVEVNAAPGLRMHLEPSFGQGRAVGEAIINELFPNQSNGRIPVVAVAGTNGKTTTVRLTSHLLKMHGDCVGMTTTDGVYIGEQRIDTGDCAGPRSARNVLLHPDVDAAVLETARGGVLREGLAFDECDVAIVTNIGLGDHLGLSYISTVEDLAVVKRVIVQNVSPTGMAVLNAADPIVANMADNCPGQVTFFASEASHPVLQAHRAAGKRVVFVEQGQIVLAEGEQVVQRFALADIPLTGQGLLGFQVENTMAALGAAWALGRDWDEVRRGLASFTSDADTAPGRFNVFSYAEATVIADYGHNPDAINALTQAIATMPAQRRMVVISGAGDRRDEDLRQQTRILGDAFDTVVLYQDACQRGRADGEVISLLREGLADATRTRDVQVVRGAVVAIDHALGQLQAGDLCLILIDQVEEALAHIKQRIAEAKRPTPALA